MVVGTPGRLAELSRDGSLQTHKCAAGAAALSLLRWVLPPGGWVAQHRARVAAAPSWLRAESAILLHFWPCRTRLLVLDEVDQLLAPQVLFQIVLLGCVAAATQPTRLSARGSPTPRLPSIHHPAPPLFVLPSFQFREEMVRLCEHTGKRAPGGRQTLLVSATLTPRVLQMCAPWCPDPVPVFVGVAPPGAEPVAEEGPAAGARRGDAAAAAAVAGGEPRERRPSWGWGDAKSPSADAADYNPGTSSAGGLGSAAAAAASMPPHLEHHYVASAPQHKVDTLR